MPQPAVLERRVGLYRHRHGLALVVTAAPPLVRLAVPGLGFDGPLERLCCQQMQERPTITVMA